MIGLRLADDRALPKPSQTEAKALMHVVEPLGRRWGDGSYVAEMLDDMTLLAENRDHLSILT